MPEEKYLRPKLRSANPLYSFLQKAFLNQKLNNWLGYFLISCIAGGFGYLIATDTKTGLMVLGLVVGFCIVTACLVDVELALYINMVYACIASHISRLLFNDNFPFGVVADTLIGVSFLALFIRKHDLKKNTNQFFQQKPIVFLFLVFLYLCLEIFNPAGRSLTGWFQIIRKVAEPLFILFIAYNIFSDYAKIRRFLKVL